MAAINLTKDTAKSNKYFRNMPTDEPFRPVAEDIETLSQLTLQRASDGTLQARNVANDAYVDLTASTFYGNLVGNVSGTVTESTGTVVAAGSNQGNATLIVYNFTSVTGADATKGVILPTTSTGKLIVVSNIDAFTLKVYPPSGGKINRGSANAAITMAANTTAFFAGDMEATTDYSYINFTSPNFGAFTGTLTGNVTGDLTGNVIGSTITAATILNLLANAGVGNIGWHVNQSGILYPDTDNTHDIGNPAANSPRYISATREYISKGIDTTGGYGLLNRAYVTASVSASGGATETILVNVPTGTKVIATQIRLDSIVILGGGGVSLSFAYGVGTVQSIATGVALAQNTKVNKFYETNVDTDITSGITTIIVTPDAGTITSGTISAVVYYEYLTSITDL